MKRYALHLIGSEDTTTITVDLTPDELALVTCLAEQFDEEARGDAYKPELAIEAL